LNTWTAPGDVSLSEGTAPTTAVLPYNAALVPNPILGPPPARGNTRSLPVWIHVASVPRPFRRKWYAAPDKSLTFSILLFSDLEPVISGWLPILSGVAIQKALAQFNASVKLKWPNDLLLNGKKIGGILCESKVKGNLLNQVVIGIGLNVNETKEDFDPAIQSSANSLHIASNKFYQRERVLAEILNELEPWISGLPKNIDKIQFEWETACGHLKEKIQFHNGNECVPEPSDYILKHMI
jgi:biotin-[acetyl-CoA-carboxylase] ligase BirA-like protein